MGENAKKSWEWHNTVVGEGYQARGVVRQRVGEFQSVGKVIDMRGPVQKVGATDLQAKHLDSSVSKSERRDSSNKPPSLKFNPLLQALSNKLEENARNTF
jgi:hypothetical protein